MTHTQPGERGNKSSFKGCMVAIRDASYIFQSLLMKGNILAYYSFFEKKEDLWREHAPLISIYHSHPGAAIAWLAAAWRSGEIKGFLIVAGGHKISQIWVYYCKMLCGVV